MLRVALVASLLAPFLLASSGSGSAADANDVTLSEFTIDPQGLCAIRDEWLAGVFAAHPEGSWVPLRVELSDSMLARLHLPPREALLGHRFAEPTLMMPDGSSFPVTLPAASAAASTSGVATFAGSGCLGIRPGAWLLTVTDQEIGWCSMAHVYGAPGSYQVSTAGHCGKVGDVATVIAATGNRAGAEGVVLLDFGKFAKSTGDAGIGKDWALISVDAPWQRLVSPTMCQWGGPVGMYTKTGAAATLTWQRGSPSGVATNPDPLLVQSIVHYGHGTGVGAGGTGRAAQVLEWKSTDYSFLGTITPGDSGSGSNTVGGDAIGAEREAAGINTHLYVGTSYYAQYGLGIMAGTRATVVQAALANGQLVPYPAPVPGAP